jgi:hypothetical protein
MLRADRPVAFGAAIHARLDLSFGYNLTKGK